MEIGTELKILYEKLVKPFVGGDAEFLIRKAENKEDYNAMTCIPAFIGKKFDSDEIRLMLIGRAVNGWSAEWGEDVEVIVEQALSIRFDMSEIDGRQPVNENTPDEYNFNRCCFMNLGKRVACELGLVTDKVAEHLLWSNMYKVAPINGGNPNGKVQKLQRQAAIEILQKEIELHKPSHILFVTDIDWMYATWRNNKEERSFANAFGILDEYGKVSGKRMKVFGVTKEMTIETMEYVKALGFYEKIPCVVCVRPEKRPIEAITRDVIKAFKMLKNM